MKRVYVFASLACLSLGLTACSSNAAKPAPTAVPKNAPTPVPQTLQGYASLADPTLKQSVQEGGALLTMVRNTSSASDFETLGNACTQYGGDFSDQNSSFRQTWVPQGAKKVYHNATQAYKTLLSATDECGIAADSRDKKQLSTVENDLSSSLYVLKQAESVVRPWNRSQG